MTGEKDVILRAPHHSGSPDFEIPRETEPELARILRRAAGLEDLPDPLEYTPGGNWVRHYTGSILSVLPMPISYLEKHPSKIARELEALQLDLGEIRRRIEKIDGITEGEINTLDSQNYREFHEITSTDDGNRMEELWRAFEEEPPETWTVPAAVAAIRRLERAIPAVIDRAEYQSAHRPVKGRKKNFTAHTIAEVVAEYVRDVTGELPGPRRRYSGSDFERTLAEVFALLELKADPQQPAKASLSKLGKDA